MENEKTKPRMQRYEVLINDLTTNARVKYGARVAVERELLQEAADALKCLTGPDTGYATGYQIGYACGKTDSEIGAAKDINVPTNVVVEVSGGMVQNVWANRAANVDVADLDAQDEADIEAAQNILDVAREQGYVRVW